MNIIIMNCIADFVALTEESKYTDTNVIFEKPNANIVIQDFSYDIEDIIQRIDICEDNLILK